MQSISHDKGKGPTAPENVDTLTNDELSSSSSPSLNLSPVKNTWESTRTISHKRPSPHLAFSDAVGGASRTARKEAGGRQYRLVILNLLEFKWPTTIQTNPSQRNKSFRYDYHRDHGHETDKCRILKFMVEKLIKEGHLGKYIREIDHKVELG